MSKREVKLDRELSELDNFVIKFIKLLKNYVIVSGYVSILLGRTRATEDVDLLVPKMEKHDFISFWRKVHDEGFWCINTSNADEAFDILNEHAIRFAKKEKPVPNIEFKVIKNDLDKFSYDNRIKVILAFENLYISPIELQIAYKLFLGSEKDIEDARHIYSLLKDKINKEELISSLETLGVFNKLGLLENGKY